MRPVDVERAGVQSERARMAAPPAGLPEAVADRPLLFDEDNKAAAIQADELGEQHRQLPAPDHVRGAGVQARGLVQPPNPVQVPVEPRRALDQLAEAPRHRQNDEDRDMQGDRAVDYGKRHQAIDIL